MSSKKKRKSGKRRNLRSKIYELKQFINKKIDYDHLDNCCRGEMYLVLQRMCDLFDIPRIESFLSDGEYEVEIKKTLIPKIKPKERSNSFSFLPDPATASKEEVDCAVRRLFGME